MGGGAWPFLVGGVICLVNSDNERDLILLNSRTSLSKIRLISMGQTNGRGRWRKLFSFALFFVFEIKSDFRLSAISFFAGQRGNSLWLVGRDRRLGRLFQK